MLLKDTLENTGEWFFNRRSYLPLVLVFLLFLERRHIFLVGNSWSTDTLFCVGCLGVSATGFLVRALCIGFCRRGTSGRNTKGQYAQSINTDGIYSVMRNPLYVGNFFIVLGLVLLSQSLEMVAITTLLYFCFYIPIILREEAFLLKTFGQDYERYSQRTPALVPRLSLWRRPTLAFNVRRLLYREHDTLMGIVAGFFFIHLFRRYCITGRFALGRSLPIFFLTGLAVWFLLKSMKRYLKRTDRGA